MKNIITVIPVGPGDPSLLTLQASDLLCSNAPLYLRTEHHPIADWLKEKTVSYTALDDLYEKSEDFDQMNLSIARELIQAASSQSILYAVPDPSSDESVRVLGVESEKKRIDIRVLPGVSSADVCNAACHSFMDRQSYQFCPAVDFSLFPWTPAVPLYISEMDSRILAGEVKLKLNHYLNDMDSVFFLSPSLEVSRRAQEIPLCELDRQKNYDHTTAVFIPGADYTHRKRFTFDDLKQIMYRLRAQDGCPWDMVQTHDSLKPYLVEEAWEAVDAIDNREMDHLADELGDVLLQVVFHASIGESFDEFSSTDIISNICSKMMKRHPRLFASADSSCSGSSGEEGSDDEWERLKRIETGSKTLGESLEKVSSALPSLKYAMKINKKLSQIPALQRNSSEIIAEMNAVISSLLDENQQLDRDCMGRLLILCMELCSLSDTDGEVLLHEAVNRKKNEYQQIEKKILQDGRNPEDLTREQYNTYLP